MHFSKLCTFVRYFPRRGGRDGVYVERVQIPYDRYWLRADLKSMVCVLFFWGGGGYWTRVWEFALNIHAYVSYLAATTELLRENWPWVTPTLQTSKGEKRREQTRHSTKPTN